MLCKVARELDGFFTENDNGKIVCSLEESDWLPDSFSWDFHAAVDIYDPRLPSDWMYKLASDCVNALTIDIFHENITAVDDIEDGYQDARGCIANMLVPVSTSEVIGWAADHGDNRALIDDAVDELGFDCDDPSEINRFVKAARLGYHLAVCRMLDYMWGVIQQEAAKRLDS
jgi:hypothetical protein